MAIQQYIRQVRLIVGADSGAGLDLSKMHITFDIKKSDAETPNAAEIVVYNLNDDTAARIRNEYTKVILQAGYVSNFGTIFSGTIKQVRLGKENGTDSTLMISAGDGDQAYISSTVNTTLAAGASQNDQIAAAAQPMTQYGVTQGYIGGTDSVGTLARGKVMYGMSRDYIRQSAVTTGTTWSIQDGALQLVPRTGVLPGTAVVLSPTSGLIGTPEQTNDGVKLQCLLNPMIRVGGVVRIDHATVAEAAAQNGSKASASQAPVALSSNGLYRVLVVEYEGDTHGGPWYSKLNCLAMDASAPAGEEVSPE